MSWLTPCAPNICTASSMTFSATRGATTLIWLIQGAAARASPWSIIHAALRQSSRAISISMRHSAMMSKLAPSFGQLLAERLAAQRTPAHQLQRHLGLADRPHAMMDAAGPEPALRDLEAPALAEDQIVLRHADIVEADVHMAVRRVVVAIDASSAAAS